MATQYPLNHSAITYPFSVFCALNMDLFFSQSPVNQISAFYINLLQTHTPQSISNLKPLKLLLLFNASPTFQSRLVILKFSQRLFAAIIHNAGKCLINSFNFKAATRNYLGTGNDQLKGGAGMDVYQFTGIYGLDTINDSDGQGVIMVGNTPLNGGKQWAHNVYYNISTQYTYTLSGAVGDQTLVIRKDGDSNQIIVQHWSASKNLGITLDDNVTPPPEPETARTIVGDLKPQDFEDVLVNRLQQAANDNEWRMAA